MKGLIQGSMILTVSAVLAACGGNEIKGDGKIISQARTQKAFSKLAASGNFVLNVQASQTAPMLKVKTDENILPYVISKVEGDTLKISVKKGFKIEPTTPVKVTLFTNKFTEAELQGKNNLVALGLRGDSFELDVNGQGSSTLKGQTKLLDIETKGQAHVNATDLTAKEVKIGITGEGKVAVTATNKLSVKIKGLGQVNYSGNPPIINQEIYGGGTLSKSK